MQLFGKTFEQKYTILTEKGFRCAAVDYKTTSAIRNKQIIKTRYVITGANLGDIAVGDTPEEAWRKAFKVLGL